MNFCTTLIALLRIGHWSMGPLTTKTLLEPARQPRQLSPFRFPSPRSRRRRWRWRGGLRQWIIFSDVSPRASLSGLSLPPPIADWVSGGSTRSRALSRESPPPTLPLLRSAFHSPVRSNFDVFGSWALFLTGLWFGFCRIRWSDGQGENTGLVQEIRGRPMQRGYHLWRVPEALRYPSLPRRHWSLGRGLIWLSFMLHFFF